MSATMNQYLVNKLESILMLSFHPENVYWSSLEALQKRHIHLQLVHSSQNLRDIKKHLKQYVLSTTDNNYKAIVCQNVASSLKKLQEELIIHNIDNNYIGDVVIVEGKLHTELKGEITKSFTGCINDVESLTNDDDRFYARILLGTTGCIGAGLDCDDVRLVIRNGVPNSIVNFIQEIGRCGRNRECLNQNNTASDHCVLLYNVEDFCYMEQRIHSGSNDDDSKKHQLHELYRVLRLIMLDQGCWHALLENECKHIMYSGVNILGHIAPCLNTCLHCDGLQKEQFLRLMKQGVCDFIIEVMIMDNKSVAISELGSLLYQYKNVGVLVYGLRATRPRKKLFCDNTILQLLASGIIVTRANADVELQSRLCHPEYDVVNGKRQPRYELEEYWTMIDTYEFE